MCLIRKNENPHLKSSVSMRVTGIFLCFAMIFPVVFTGCKSAEKTVEDLADYGQYGTAIAQNLASGYPYRIAYSPEEKAAGAFIKHEFEKLGYKVEEQIFQAADNSGSSSNYIVKIPGQGMMFLNSQGKYTLQKKQIIVGAHYDTIYGTKDAASFPDFDGIQDNACGIGCLLTLAKQLKTQVTGYDVILVAFGAGDSNAQGAKAYADKMTKNQIASTDAMYCIESIYAGDKLYASAGWSSLAAGDKYEMRRKLYEAYDAVYDNQLLSKNGVDLLYNESGISVDVNGDGKDDVYREVTLTQSDYIPFDNAGIPTVFIESYDYNYAFVAGMKETKNLKLQTNGGIIRHTDFDSQKLLEEVMTKDQLMTRINNTAFIILKAIQKGAHNSLSKEAFAAGTTIAPSIHVLVTVTPPAGATTGKATAESLSGK